jgi:hypothetical protein
MIGPHGAGKAKKPGGETGGDTDQGCDKDVAHWRFHAVDLTSLSVIRSEPRFFQSEWYRNNPETAGVDLIESASRRKPETKWRRDPLTGFGSCDDCAPGTIS